MGFTTTFKVGAMPYDMVERSMGAVVGNPSNDGI